MRSAKGMGMPGMSIWFAGFLLTPVLAGRPQGVGRNSPSVLWYPSVEDVTALRSSPIGPRAVEKKYILVYIKPAPEKPDSTLFHNIDLAQASRLEWGFVRMVFNPQDPWQKSWRIPQPNVCLGCDIHGNEFMRARMGIEQIRALIRNVPELVKRYRENLESRFSKAKGVQALVDLAAEAQPGYQETGDIQARLQEIFDASWLRLELTESVGIDYAIDFLEDLVKVFRTTLPGVQAELRISRLERARGNVPAAIARLDKITKYDERLLKSEVDEARKLLIQIDEEGQDKIDAALRGDPSRITDTLRTIARDYKGTKAGWRAAEEAGKAK